MGTTCSRLSAGGMLGACASRGVRNDGESRCLDAFTVALSQAHSTGDGEKAWYVSTLELQLASLDFCRACRSFPILHVRVHYGTPRTLWGPRQNTPQQNPWQRTLPLRSKVISASATDENRVIRSRVPSVVMAVCWKWTRWGEDLVSEDGLDQRDGLQHLHLCYNRSWPGRPWSGLRSMDWPPTLRGLMLNVSLAEPNLFTSWPPNLQELSLGPLFNQPLSRIVWPASLRRLSLETCSYFHSSVAGLVLPVSLQQLVFGDDFNQPVAEVLLDVNSTNPSPESCGQRLFSS
ncbi:unnamed protein product [Scytosiphon promiscuus]